MLIAQLSDLHVRPEGHAYADLVPSNAMARAAVRHVNGLERRPDLVIVTGDLVDGGTDAEYRMVRDILDGLEVPYHVLPGNHDERQAFRRAFADHSYLPVSGPLHYCLDDHAVRLIALDSTVPGKHHGDIDAGGLAWLEEALARDTGRPAMVMMHHPPFLSGIPYLDQYRHFGAEGIGHVLERFRHVERVICGHVHRSMAVRFANTLAMSCPSTAFQIALRLSPAAAPASLLEPPGCLLHLWLPGTGLVSHLSPIGDFGQPLPFF